MAEYTVKFGIGEIPRPPNSGPASAWCRERIEFWRDMPFRLHDRQVFHRDGDGWRIEALYP